MAEREGARVAAAIAAEVRGEAAPAPFDGRGHCFIEMGRDVAAAFEGAFYAEPAPEITMLPAGPEHAAAKRAFETERLARWFGQAGD
jgi:sulfide:quinone oxidoreductase